MDKKNLRLYDAMGSLAKRWYVTYKDASGRWVKCYGNINTHTTQEARLEAARALMANLCTLPAGVGAGWAAVAWEWLAQNAGRWRLKTLQTYSSKLRIFVAFANGRALGVELINSFFMAIATKHIATKNAYLQTLKLFNKECWHVPRLLDSVRKCANNSTPAKYYTRSQIGFLRATLSTDTPKLWDFVQFLYYCFIRPSELRALRVCDVVLEENKINIPANISKNKKTQSVAIPAAFAAECARIVAGRSPNARLFPVGKNYYTNLHRLILQKHGFDTKVYKLYSWKHTGAVACVRAGVHIKELQIQLRHHSLDQVNDYLRQLGVNDLQNLTQKFPSL